jgi:cobalamin biosynthesis protein CobD/CbiB
MARDLLLGVMAVLSDDLVNWKGACLTGAGMAVVAVEVNLAATPWRLKA